MALQKFRDSWEVWRRKINAEIGHGIVIDALNVLFNPSHSTLVSRNVQSAIDELDSKKINFNAVSAVGKTGQYGDLVGAPELAEVATTGSYNDLSDKPSIPSAQVQSDWGQTDNSKVDYIKNKPSLATVATSGNYNDLSNKPTLATVATSGSYNDLSDKPSIPSAQVQSDWGQTDNSKVDFIKNKPTLGTASTKNSTNAVTQNSTDLVESGAVFNILTGFQTKVLFSVNKSSSRTINVRASSQFILVCCGAVIDLMAIFLISGQSDGMVRAQKMSVSDNTAGSNINLSTGTNSFTVQNLNSGNYLNCYLYTLTGGLS